MAVPTESRELQDLDEATSLHATDIIYALQDPAGTPAPVKVPLDMLADFVGAGGGGMGIGGAVVGGVAGSLLFVGAGPLLAQDAALVWDATNKRLSIGDSVTATNADRAFNICSTAGVIKVLRVSASASAGSPSIEFIHRTTADGADDKYWDMCVVDAGLAFRNRVGATITPILLGDSGQLGIGGANFGTAGQVVTSGGVSAAPSWADPLSIGKPIGGVTVGSVLFAGSDLGLAQNNARLFWDNSAERLGIGLAAPEQPLHLMRSGVSGCQLQIDNYHASNSNRPILAFRSATGTFASPTDVVVGNQLGEIFGQGYAGGAFRNVTTITMEVDAGTVSGSSLPSRILFETTPNGSVSRVGRVVIGGDGGIAIQDGIAAPAARAGWGTFFIDSADGDLKIIFGDGVVKTISVDS